MNERLSALRGRMRERGLDAYLILSADAHQSEYVAEHWRSRAWLTGFTGSNGLAAVTLSGAGLWTDGRYFIQAERQLSGSGFELFRAGRPDVPTFREWLNKNKCARLGFDGRAVPVSEFEKLKEELPGAAFEWDCDLIGDIWTDRPPLPDYPVFGHPIEFAGLTRAEKLRAVRDETRKKKASAYLITALDSVAWLLNIRGRDVPGTPVAYAFAFVSENEAHLFIEQNKLPGEMRNQLISEGYTPHDYDDIYAFLQSAPEGGALYYDPAATGVSLAEAVPRGVKRVAGGDIVSELKAVKNAAEIAHTREANIREGVVMVKLLKQLDEWAAGERRETLTEYDIHGILTESRLKQPHYLGPSFPTIAAYAENAAIVHYSPEKDGCKALKPEGMLLIDTGSQYLDGTTDITRTVALGAVTDQMRRAFTLVLKGHIALASARFPKGTAGVQLDAFARRPLWDAGMDYLHGTGHGIGYCLGVHEGPQNISTRPNDVKLTPGMLCSNEPGYYLEGGFGIRIENTVLVTESSDGGFLCFETISFCPVDARLIDAGLLTRDEIKWLNNYHQRVIDVLSPCLDESEAAWLRNAAGVI